MRIITTICTPEPQNSAGMQHREVNWGREKPQSAGSWRKAAGEKVESSWRENGKVETAAGTEKKREKGEKRWLNSIKTL